MATFDVPDDDMKHGLLLVGHGTRDTDGCEQFLATADSVATRLADVAVEPCFLELATPSINEAVRRLAAREIDQLSVMPLLLFAAGHAKDDIPRAVDAAVENQGLTDKWRPAGDRRVRQLPHLGCHPELLALSTLRQAEALAERREIDCNETTTT